MPDITSFILLAPPILLALTIHEFAHGWVADKLGDPTARMAGRLTMNPLAHLDPIGTLALFLVHIGWAKPVPINPYNFRNGRTGEIMVSLAGVTANMILALFFGLVIRALDTGGPLAMVSLPDAVVLMIVYGVVINLILAVFNLIPIPPLDGSRVLGGLLPPDLEREYRKLDRFGPVLILVLVLGASFLNIPFLWWIISPFISFFSKLFAGIDLMGTL
ncbi:MAG: site-2 protease family protein [Candidatus Zixiibacteriota bacterium]|nr:MAG: site-2 protease family protein [candidate division Zixibacteria bacterium]